MFVVFDTRNPHADKRYFKTAAGAKRAMTCANRNAGKTVYNWVEQSWFLLAYPVGRRVTKSLMTGEIIVIPADTPYCCDPSTERYWSM